MRVSFSIWVRDDSMSGFKSLLMKLVSCTNKLIAASATAAHVALFLFCFVTRPVHPVSITASYLQERKLKPGEQAIHSLPASLALFDFHPYLANRYVFLRFSSSG